VAESVRRRYSARSSAVAAQPHARAAQAPTFRAIDPQARRDADPRSRALERLFRDSRMFGSADAWRAAGFGIVVNNPHKDKILVARHSALAGYLFKRYRNGVPSETQLAKYEGRIDGARRLKALIDERKLRRVVVPQKWLYELPRKFSREPSYVLIVEELPVLDKASSEQAHRHIDEDTLRELCAVFYACADLDFTAVNAPFTKDGQVAFIDTEYLKWHDERSRKAKYMDCVHRYLTGSRLDFAKRMWVEKNGGA
jgi:hypothetical protein